MVEFYTVKRIDNSRLVRRGTAGFFRRSGRHLVLGIVISAAVLAYAWQRYECVELSYQLDQTDRAETQAAQLNSELKLELATLQSPARIDLLARDQLGMTIPQPGQIIQPGPSSAREMADAQAPPGLANFR